MTPIEWFKTYAILPEAPGAAGVLFVVSACADEQGVCRESTDTIAELLGRGKSTVNRHLQDMEGEGYITRSRRRNGKPGGTHSEIKIVAFERFRKVADV